MEKKKEKQDKKNKPSTCIIYCKSLGFSYAGVRENKCRCGDAKPSGDIDDAICNEQCPGGQEVCGGSVGSLTGVTEAHWWWNVFSTKGTLQSLGFR